MFSFAESVHKETFITIYRQFLWTIYVAHTVCHAEIHKSIADESQKP